MIDKCDNAVQGDFEVMGVDKAVLEELLRVRQILDMQLDVHFMIVVGKQSCTVSRIKFFL